MAYTILKSDGTILATIPDGQIDTTSTSVSLFGRNYAGYGQYIDTNFTHMLENFADNVPPSNPLQGQLWFDTNTNTLRVCPADGSTIADDWYTLTTINSTGITSFDNITATGNISANNATVSYDLGAANIYCINLSTSANANIATANIGNLIVSGNLTPTGIKTDNYYYANGVTIPFGYGNSNVANYLPTFAGTISAGTILVSGNANVTSNISTGGIKANNYYWANGSPVSFSGTYSNSNVAAYLPTYTGTVGTGAANFIGTNITLSGNASVTGNIAGGNLTITSNVTSGNLTTSGILTATGNITGGNLTTSGALTVSGISTLGAVGNVKISGGSSGNVLTTYGNGTLYWGTGGGGGGGGGSNIANGTSNVSILTANGNVVVYVNGNNTANITSTGANITGNLSVTSNLSVTGTISSTAGISSTTPAVTQAASDSSTKIATTAFVKQYAPSSKIQFVEFGVSPLLGGQITLYLHPTYLDFRSTASDDGTITSLSVPSTITLTVPASTALGAVNGVQSRLVILAVNNGGTVQLAVTNIAGGINLDETTYINTTNVSTGTTTSTVYSSTTGSYSYRVVGFLDITYYSGGWYQSGPTLVSRIQGIGGQALAALSSLGYGQTWQYFNNTARTAGTTYYNSTGKPIMISLQAYGGGDQYGSAQLYVNGVQIAYQSVDSQAAQGPSFQLTGIIPPSASYYFTVSFSSGTGYNVYELR